MYVLDTVDILHEQKLSTRTWCVLMEGIAEQIAEQAWNVTCQGFECNMELSARPGFSGISVSAGLAGI